MDEDRAVRAVDDADFDQVADGVGADEHREAVVEVVDENWVVEGMDHVVVADAVFSSARGDQRSIHINKLACETIGCK